MRNYKDHAESKKQKHGGTGHLAIFTRMKGF